MLLDILVGCGDVAVACLVTGNDNTSSIGKVTDAGVLKGIKLIAVVPAECSPHFLPAFVELVRSHFLTAGQKACSEEIMGVGPLKDTKVKHQLDDRLVQTDLRVTVVLAELL